VTAACGCIGTLASLVIYHRSIDREANGLFRLALTYVGAGAGEPRWPGLACRRPGCCLPKSVGGSLELHHELLVKTESTPRSQNRNRRRSGIGIFLLIFQEVTAIAGVPDGVVGYADANQTNTPPRATRNPLLISQSPEAPI
jgi:hypothetical protein